MDGEKLFECPYDKHHQVRGTRSAIHLYKCRKQYVKKQKALGLGLDVVQCRYDCGHRLLLPELFGHEGECHLKPSTSLAGLEDLFDKDILQEVQSLLKEEQEASGIQGMKKNLEEKKSKDDKKEKHDKKDEGGIRIRGVEELDWETDEDWGREGTGEVFYGAERFRPYY